jgi:hypothetical protein
MLLDESINQRLSRLPHGLTWGQAAHGDVPSTGAKLSSAPRHMSRTGAWPTAVSFFYVLCSSLVDLPEHKLHLPGLARPIFLTSGQYPCSPPMLLACER